MYSGVGWERQLECPYLLDEKTQCQRSQVECLHPLADKRRMTVTNQIIWQTINAISILVWVWASVQTVHITQGASSIWVCVCVGLYEMIRTKVHRVFMTPFKTRFHSFNHKIISTTSAISLMLSTLLHLFRNRLVSLCNLVSDICSRWPATCGPWPIFGGPWQGWLCLCY